MSFSAEALRAAFQGLEALPQGEPDEGPALVALFLGASFAAALVVFAALNRRALSRAAVAAKTSVALKLQVLLSKAECLAARGRSRLDAWNAGRKRGRSHLAAMEATAAATLSRCVGFFENVARNAREKLRLNGVPQPQQRLQQWLRKSPSKGRDDKETRGECARRR